MTNSATPASEHVIPAAPTLDDRMRAYARLIVEAGCALKPGQDLFVRAGIEVAPFVRMVAEAAYDLGAHLVTVRYHDQVLDRMQFDRCGMDVFETFPEWAALLNNSMARNGAAILSIDSDDPEAMAGIDARKLIARAKAGHVACKEFYDAMDFGRCVWCIVGAASPAWARKVFPDLGEQEAVEALWDAIFTTVRLQDADAAASVTAWNNHRKSFSERCAWLNEQRFDALHYTNAHGTDITVGLPAAHLWNGGGDTLQDGTQFFPNMPTEEIFTTPDRRRTDGTVVSALPLVHNGNLIENFRITFEAGKVVSLQAERGQDVLQAIVDTDENSCSLGEVALVPYISPIRNTGTLFYSTLYDENASCHMALGQGFPDCYQGGLQMGEDELFEAGVNKSATHVDFMVGTEDLNIDGIKADGTVVPVFRNGNWAHEL